jgi:hypothetical protein
MMQLRCNHIGKVTVLADSLIPDELEVRQVFIFFLALFVLICIELYCKLLSDCLKDSWQYLLNTIS